MPVFDKEDQFSIERLINRTTTAEGTSLPPQQRGPFRVPYVAGVRVSSPSPTKYIISWREPENFTGKIAGYNIFYTCSANVGSPVFIGGVPKSPAELQILAPTTARLTFFVQTRLNNGFVNPAEQSPSATTVAA